MRKILSLVLTLAMLFSFCNIPAFAEDAPAGKDFTGYTSETGIWGEVWGNAKTSFVIKVLDAENSVMGTTSLNNIGGIIDGDVTVTWNLKLDAASNTDEYWKMEWTTPPSADNIPAKVELWVDGEKVSGGNVVLNGPDDGDPIIAAVSDAEGKIKSFVAANGYVNNMTDVAAKLQSAANQGGNITLVRDIELSETITVPEDVAVNLDLNGKKITVGYQDKYDEASESPKHIYAFDVYGSMTIKDSGDNGSISARGIYVQDGAIFNVTDGAVYGIDNNGGSAIYQYGGTINISGGLVEQTAEYTYNYAISAGGGNINISNGSIVGKHGALSVSGANANVTGGELICTGNAGWTDNVVYVSAGSLKITDGTILHKGQEVNADSGAGVVAANEEVTITIEGGSITGLNGALSGNANTTVTGGTFIQGAYGTNHYSDVSTYVPEGYEFDAETGTVVASAITGLKGEGTKENPYLINNLEELKWFRDDVNNGNRYNGEYIKLTSDIDLKDEEWTPIGDREKDQGSFLGTFDGDNHTISNLWINQYNKTGAGFFSKIGMQTEYVSGTVKNFTFNNVTIVSTKSYVGVIAQAPLGALIENVNITGKVNIQGYGYVGGIVGHGYPTINNSSVIAEGDITATYWGAGIIFGFAGDYGAKINNATVEGIGTGLTVHAELGGAAAVTGSPYGAKINGATVSNVTVTSNSDYCMGYVTAGGTVENAAVTNVTATANGQPITPADIVAEVNGKLYFSLQAALANGGNITILRDITVDAVTIPENVTINLDLNGKTLTGYIAPCNPESLTIKNGSIVNTNSSYSAIEINSGKLTLEDVNIDSARHAVRIDGAVTATIDGGTYKGGVDSSKITAHAVNVSGAANVTIKDGQFYGPKANINSDSGVAVNVQAGATVTINGGTFKDGKNNTLAAAGTLKVSGGTFDQDPSIYLADGYAVAKNADNTYNVAIAVVLVNNKPYVSFDDAVAAVNESTAENITVELLADVEVPMKSFGTQTGGSGEYKIGTENTKTITIDLGGNNLNITTTYWSAIGAKNDEATITIKNGSMESTGNSAETWNANDLRFCNCNWVFENVTFNKEVALANADKTTTMKNVKINGTGNYYALWITADGQTVNIDGLEIVTPGRGIKIDEEYVNTDGNNIYHGEEVTLSIANATFTTAKKAAILVKNSASTTITASGKIDITGVVADSKNLVWVDEDSADYADMVTVSGAAVKVEGAPENYVAQIGDTKYSSLQAALNEAKDGDTITLLWSEGDDPIAMNGEVYGNKTVTITGTATVDWSKGHLFIGRGGEGNGTVIFDKANLTADSNQATYGIHVSGREKDTKNKYDGTLEIKDSTIELDYLINKGTMTLDNSTLTVKNGFSIGGRPASETESGEDATATLTLNNNSKVVVNNHNGMGLGYEAIGVMNIDATSTFETTQSFLVTKNGTMNIEGTAKVVGTLTNNGTINVSGNTKLNIETLTASSITGTGTIVIDATGMTAGKVTTISANASDFTGTIDVINGGNLSAEIDDDGNIILVTKEEKLNTRIYFSYRTTTEVSAIDGKPAYRPRVYAGVDSLKYKAVGFEYELVNTNLPALQSKTSTVYKTLTAKIGDENKPFTPELFKADENGKNLNYIFALNIWVPEAYGNYQLKVRAYAEKYDGDIIYSDWSYAGLNANGTELAQ